MAAIPPEFGGGREIGDNPEEVGAAATVGDVAALGLQLLHTLGGHIGDGFIADRDRLAERFRLTLRAADAQKARENSTRELQPMNAIPAADYGPTNNLAAIRLNQIPQFSGATNDPREVVRWIARVLATAEAHTLTRAATINLMVHASTGSASDYIDSMREAGANIGTVIRNLELRYGELCLPEEALTKANVLPRGENETLSDFLDKLRYLGRMAKRGIADANARNQAIDAVVEANIRRALHKGVRKALEERILNRTRMGQPPFSVMDLEKECILLEQRRAEYKQDKGKAQGKVMTVRQVHAIKQTAPPRAIKTIYQIQGSQSPDSCSSDSTSDEESEDNLASLAGDLFAGEIRRVEARYQAKGIIPDRQRVFRRAIRGFNKRQFQGDRYPRDRYPNDRNRGNRYDRYADKSQSKPSVAAVTSTGASIPTSGPPNKLPDSPRKPINELLALANCTRGDCIHCGVTGHMMTSDACPLRGKPLMDRACTKCKKGLHPVDDCLSVFQQPTVAHVYESSSDSDLNDE